MTRTAKVFVNNVAAALLTETADGAFVLQYLPNYIDTETLPISLTLPIRTEPYCADYLFPFLDGLIPEGWLLNIASENWKLDPNDRMGLLMTFCKDCIGNVHVEACTEINS